MPVFCICAKGFSTRRPQSSVTIPGTGNSPKDHGERQYLEPNKATVLVDLKQVVGRLAAPAPEQVEYLSGLGVLPCVDELALEFDDVNVPLVVIDNMDDVW
jgi:hypothetical protein